MEDKWYAGELVATRLRGRVPEGPLLHDNGDVETFLAADFTRLINAPLSPPPAPESGGGRTCG